MHEWIWAWLLALALHCGTLEGTDFFQVSCNDDVILPCRVRQQTDKYRYVVWYRGNQAILKRKSNEMTFYNKSSHASLGVNESLVMRQVQPSDSGKYLCFLAADIGAKDQDSSVTLNVTECATPASTWPVSEDPNSKCPADVLEIPALLAVLAFVLVCLIKIALCFIAVLVCKKIRGCEEGGDRKRRRSSCKY